MDYTADGKGFKGWAWWSNLEGGIGKVGVEGKW
jgi:hypothetical protein